MSVEAKWKANQEKASFLKAFPGLLPSWDKTIGQTVQHIIPFSSSTGSAVIVFSNSTFGIAAPLSVEPRDVKDGVASAREILEPQHPEAFVEYDRLSHVDQEAGRLARMENILGAIHNNVDAIPELKDHIRSLVQTWES